MRKSFQGWPILFSAAIVFVVHFAADNADAQRGRGGRGGSGWTFVAKKYDANKDGSVSAEEYTRGEEGFKSLDKNGDGVLTNDDWSSGSRGRRGGSGEVPAVGQTAPDFSLTEIRDESKTVTLSDFAGKQPVALIFGSCT